MGTAPGWAGSGPRADGGHPGLGQITFVVASYISISSQVGSGLGMQQLYKVGREGTFGFGRTLTGRTPNRFGAERVLEMNRTFAEPLVSINALIFPHALVVGKI